MAKKKLPKWALDEAREILGSKDPVAAVAAVLVSRRSAAEAVPRGMAQAIQEDNIFGALACASVLVSAFVSGLESDPSGITSDNPGEGKFTVIRGGKE